MEARVADGGVRARVEQQLRDLDVAAPRRLVERRPRAPTRRVSADQLGRLGTSWTIQPLPSGSLNERNDP